MQRVILVTGGAGYIGSHVVIALLEAGHEVIVLDDLSTGHPELLPEGVPFVHGDAGDSELVARIFRTFPVAAVVHLAGSIFVAESIVDPLKFYRNNTGVTQRLVETCLRNDVKKLVFSSSAAVYGRPETVPIVEETLCNPISPYGCSKLASEFILRDVAAATELRCAILRYFNVAGADPKGRSGEATRGSTHLIKVASEVVLGTRPYLEVFGDDYETADGTCIRDYIHVSDLAALHVAALDHLERVNRTFLANCGYGRGFSVREIISTIEAETGEALPLRIAARRAGDPPVLVADVTRLKTILDWKPQHGQMAQIVRSALAWERMLSQGELSIRDRTAAMPHVLLI